MIASMPGDKGSERTPLLPFFELLLLIAPPPLSSATSQLPPDIIDDKESWLDRISKEFGYSDKELGLGLGTGSIPNFGL
jgi:hypothetical protein